MLKYVSLWDPVTKPDPIQYKSTNREYWQKAMEEKYQQRRPRSETENYRSVSLTSVLCKLLETFIRDHMVEFVEKHKIITEFSTWTPKM